MEHVDIIIRGEALVTSAEPSEGSAFTADGAVAVRDGAVAATGSWAEISKYYSASRLHERKSGLIIPGFINAHTHASMALFRGLADDLPLKTWLENHIFPAEAKLTADLVRLGAELACAEMIRCGTTGFVDMYLFEDAVAETAASAGLRIWAGEGIFDFPSPAFPDGFQALKETYRMVEKWRGHELVTVTVDPHTPYTCGPDLLKAGRELSERTGVMMVTHLAETRWEDEEIRRRCGMSPAVYLDSMGLLDDSLLAVHCVVLQDEDISLLSDRGVRIAHCPESNLKLGSGVAPVWKFMSAGIITALGTDGAASNNDLDLMSEMDTAAKLPKGINQNPELISAEQAMAMASSWAADALHRSDLGRLEPGCRADLAVIDLDQVHLRPCYNPVSQVVYAARSGDVQDLMVNGRFLMLDRELITIDEQGLLTRLNKACSLWQ